MKNTQCAAAEPRYFPEIWSRETGTFTVSQDDVQPRQLHTVLDSLVLAVKAGAIGPKDWVQKVFGDKDLFLTFCTALAVYEVAEPLKQHWRQTLASLTSPEVVDKDFADLMNAVMAHAKTIKAL